MEVDVSLGVDCRIVALHSGDPADDADGLSDELAEQRSVDSGGLLAHCW